MMNLADGACESWEAAAQAFRGGNSDDARRPKHSDLPRLARHIQAI
jgi:hypothetical protein